MTFSKLSIQILMLASLVSSLRAETSSPRLLSDRLIVEVNGVPFTQYEIESYTLIVRTLQGKALMGDLNGAESTWQANCENFVRDMIILQSLQRRGNAQYTDDETNAKKQVIAQERLKNPFFEKEMNRLQVDDRVVMNHILSYLRIYYFIKSKIPDLDKIKSAHDLKDQSWFVEMKNNAMIHYYTDALKFHPLDQSTAPQNQRLKKL